MNDVGPGAPTSQTGWRPLSEGRTRIFLSLLVVALLAASCNDGQSVDTRDASTPPSDTVIQDAPPQDRWSAGNDAKRPDADQAAPPGTELLGDTKSGYCNPTANAPVKAPVTALSNLPKESTRMGFGLGDAPSSHSGSFNHWQGIQRLGCGKPYVVLSRSNKSYSSPDFVVAHMGSSSSTGLAWTTNLGGVFKDVPDAKDRVVMSKAVPASQGAFSNLKYRHAGGMQLVGNYLAIPFEDPTAGLDGYVAFYDLTAPTKPVFRHALRIQSKDKHLGAVGLVRLSDGTFLLVVSNDAWTKTLLFYRSKGASLASDPTFSQVGQWKLSGANKTGWVDTWWGRYQSINLISDTKGALYLVATGNNLVAGVGQDWVDLYRLKVTTGAPGASYTVRLTKVHKRQLKPGSQTVPLRDYGSFDAAAGAYVAKDGSLYIYAAEAANSLPKVKGSPSVGMSQFAP